MCVSASVCVVGGGFFVQSVRSWMGAHRSPHGAWVSSPLPDKAATSSAATSSAKTAPRGVHLMECARSVCGGEEQADRRAQGSGCGRGGGPTRRPGGGCYGQDAVRERARPGLGTEGWGRAQVRRRLRQRHQAGRLVGLRRLRLRRLHELLRGGGGGRGSMSMAWRWHEVCGAGSEWPSREPNIGLRQERAD